MSSKDEEEGAHVELKHEDHVQGVSSKGALGTDGGWQASVADAHLANINEHEDTVRKTYVPTISIHSVISMH